MVRTLNCCGVRLASPALAALASSETGALSSAIGGHQVSPSSTWRTASCRVSSGLDLGMKPLAPNSRERLTTEASSCAEIITTGICGYCPRSRTKPEKP